ncbi:hypothetical protein Bca4012_033336 [Brassica carinata]
MPGSDNGSNLANTVQTTSLTLTGPSKQLNQVCSLINVPLSPLNVGVTQWQMDKWQSYLEKMWTRVKLSTRVVSLPDPDTTVGMQIRSCCEGWKESHSQGIVIVAPKARARDKPWDHHHL